MDGPHPPLGLDSGLEGLFCDPSVLYGPEMTAFSFDDEALLWEDYSPHESVSSGGAKPYSHHASGESSSRSPAGSSLIFTPTSTQLDFQDVDNCLDTQMDEESASPEGSNDNSLDDYVHVPAFDTASDGGNQRSNISSQPARNSRLGTGSFLPSEGLRSHNVSVTHRWQQSTPLESNSNMYDGLHQRRSPLGTDTVLYQRTSHVPMTNTGGFEAPFAATNYQGDDLPYRTFHHSDLAMTSFENTAMLSQQMAHPPTDGQHMADYISHDGFALGQSTGNVLTAPIPQQPTAAVPERDSAYMQYFHSVCQNAALAHSGPSVPTVVRPQHLSNSRDRVHTLGAMYQQQVAPAAIEARVAGSTHVHHLDACNLRIQALQSLPKRSGGHLQHPQRQVASTLHDRADRVRKGGRPKNSQLNPQSREKSSAMRKVGACWRCAMQRDPCDHGDPCSRCSSMRSQRGQAYFFDCDRSKLPDFVHEFLPPSMTIMHQKQTIEDSVASSVLGWDRDNGIDIYLSSGYGPPLRWKVYEFMPKSKEYLSQLQYRQDNNSDRMMRTVNYSPPYGLLKIDPSDETLLDSYLERLLEPRWLEEFGWTFYEAESLADEFQARVLELMCKLYVNTTDTNLESLLKDILRMLLITYIMGHTLTIIDDTVSTVIANIRHSSTPRNYNQRHTSPRLANRQLKFFFAVLRNGIYEKLLKWQQQTLHTGKKKESTWLPAFCVTLGFAMVLEEVQHTLFIQADASVARNDMVREEADQQASNACERIDTRFKLLVGLFQCKYRDKKWGDNGTFGPGTPEVRDPAGRAFLQELRETVVDSRDHLQSREHVGFSQESQCYFTSRLTAKFLVPFLGLPG